MREAHRVRGDRFAVVLEFEFLSGKMVGVQ